MDTKTFKEILTYPYVIIFNNTSGNKLYKTSCSLVREEDYILKMVIHHSDNSYYRTLDYYEDIRDASVVPCKKCKPTKKLLNHVCSF